MSKVSFEATGLNPGFDMIVSYCSNMAKSGMNPKTLQYLMGYADIGTTLNVYTHVNFEDAKAEMST